MNYNTVKSAYEREGRDAALEAMQKAIEANKGQEDKLNELAFLAADFAHSEALELLFAAAVAPALTGRHGFTLLHHLGRGEESSRREKPAGAVAKTTALLLDNKVSALRKDTDQGMTCYHYAARKGLAEMVQALAEKGVKLDLTDKEGNTGIHIACEYAKHAISAEGYAKGENEKAKAAQLVEDYFLAVKAFVEGGVDKDEKNSYEKTALDFAIKSGAKKIAAYLSGSLGDEKDGAAITAGGMNLHQAVENGDVEAIKAIANSGADLNSVKDDEKYKYGGITALAIACAQLKADAAEALLASGANPVYKDGNGRMAISYFFSQNYGASYNSKVVEEKRIPRIINGMLAAGFKIDDIVDDDGNTLLLLAAASSRGSVSNRHSLKGDVIDELLKKNANCNVTNRFGETVLMHAGGKDFDVTENVMLVLLEGGADLAAADRNGNTALHYAAKQRDRNAAKNASGLLLDFGADAKAVNNEGKTALDIATEENNEALVKLLLSKM